VEVEKKERYAQALREQLEHGQCDNSTPSSTVETSTWGTADKVSQVQELMRQRIQALHEEQNRMWQRVQAALGEQQKDAEAAASRAVEAAVEHALEAALAGVLADARQQCDGLVKRATEGVAEQVSQMQSVVQSLRTCADDHGATLADHEARIRRLEEAQEEWARDRAEIKGEQGALAEAVSHLQTQMQDVSRQAKDMERVKEEMEHLQTQMQDVSRQAKDMERVREEMEHIAAAQTECARHLADLQREHNTVSEAFERLRDAHGDMVQKMAEFPRLLQKLQRLEEEMPRLAARAAREALEGARPAEPAPTPAPPPPTQVSAAAYAVLKNENELFEMHGINNIVGRAATCDACIPGSQAISNRHAGIDFDSEGRTSLRDLGSRNGTFLNDRRVPQDDRGFIMESGDAVKLGIDGPVFVFEYGPAHYARWPQNLQRASASRPVTGGNRDTGGSPRGVRTASDDRCRGSDRHRPPSGAQNHSPAPVARGHSPAPVGRGHSPAPVGKGVRWAGAG